MSTLTDDSVDLIFLRYIAVCCSQVGAVTNTFNVPGVEENCFFLKRMEEAQKLRKRINECFEIASLPGITDEDRKRLLTFVVVGLLACSAHLAFHVH